MRGVLRRLAPAAAVAVVAASFLPWTVSGAAARHSFATVRSARLLGVGPDWVGPVLGAWYFVPALVGATVLAAVLGRDRLAGAGAALTGASALVLGIAVLRSPVPAAPGVVVALVAGVVSLVAGSALTMLGVRVGPTARRRLSPPR